ncbi:MAG: hypothetical protein NTW85_09320 [Methylococcales bacterium]|nr:hypothetical protein [Methylococcales bacterium]
MQWSLFFLILWVLSGCSENCIIHPNPDVSIPICSQVKSLSEGANCLIQVFANQRETSVGLTVQQGEIYRIKATSKNTWCDASHTNTALCGEKGSNLMNIFSPRVEDSLWFSVIAEVKHTKDGEIQRLSQYDLCNTPKFEISTSGKLVLYPNDATGFYGNNSGAIWLELSRLKN